MGLLSLMLELQSEIQFTDRNFGILERLFAKSAPFVRCIRENRARLFQFLEGMSHVVVVFVRLVRILVRAAPLIRISHFGERLFEGRDGCLSGGDRFFLIPAEVVRRLAHLRDRLLQFINGVMDVRIFRDFHSGRNYRRGRSSGFLVPSSGLTDLRSQYEQLTRNSELGTRNLLLC